MEAGCSKLIMNCAMRYNHSVPCAGDFIPSEGACLKHALLFDVWICEHEGYRVYRTGYPISWKRSKFHRWLDKIGDKNAMLIFNRD